MNKKEVELTKYFDNMCINFNTKKIMFSEWEKYFKKLKETIISGVTDINYSKYVEALKSCLVYCEDYGDMYKYRKDMANLKTFLRYFEVYNLNGYTFFLYIFLFG